MTDPSKRNVCHYCRRELKEGEGRYRILQQGREMECCPSCFDATRGSPRLAPGSPFPPPSPRDRDMKP